MLRIFIVGIMLARRGWSDAIHHPGLSWMGVREMQGESGKCAEVIPAGMDSTVFIAYGFGLGLQVLAKSWCYCNSEGVLLPGRSE